MFTVRGNINRLFFIAITACNIFWICGQRIDAQEPRLFKFGSYGKLLIEVDQDDVTAALDVMAKSFAEQINKKHNLNYKFENTTYKSLSEFRNAINNIEVDCLSLPITEYFELNTDNTIEPYFTGSNGDSPFREYYILVNDDNGYSSLADLKNTELLIPQINYSSIIDMWLANEINKLEKTKGMEDFFKRIRETEYESKVILEVFFNKSDAGIVTKSAYDLATNMNPQLTSKLRVLMKSGDIITGLFALRKSLDPEAKNLLLESALSMSEDEKGRQILNLFKIDHLYRINNEMMNSARQIYLEYKTNLNSK